MSSIPSTVPNSTPPVDLSGRHVIVTGTAQGVVETPMTETIRSEKSRDTYLAQIPMSRWKSTDSVARPVCFLLSPQAICITGQHRSVNGGYVINV